MTEKHRDLHVRLDRIFSEYADVIWRLNDSRIMYPTTEEVIEINKRIHSLCGGQFGVREHNLLESAINAPKQKEVYTPGVRPEVLGYTIMERIIRNHPFIDGNKRTGVVVLLDFCKRNAVLLPKEWTHDWLVTEAELIGRGRAKLAVETDRERR